MSNVVFVDFSNKSKPARNEEIINLLCDRLYATLTKHGFHDATSKKVAMLVADQAATDIEKLQKQRQFSVTIKIEGNLSRVEDVAKSVNDQWNAEINHRISALYDAAEKAIVGTAYTSIVAMANADRLIESS